MKIAIFQVTSSFLVGGCETYSWNLARYLLQRGHGCDLIAGEVASPIHPFSEVPLLTARFVPADRVLDLGSRFRRLGERVSFAWNARNIVLGGRYDVINIHKPYDIPAALWFRRKTGCRIVWRCHGTDFYPGLGKVIGRIDAIYCVSEFARETLQRAYPVEAQVIYTGVDSDFFAPPSSMAQGEIAPRILYFGRLAGWKGVRWLVDALASVVDRPWSARIVGEGPEFANLAAQVRDRGLQQRVSVEPAVQGREQVRSLLQASDIVVFPAVGIETFSNALLEAMSTARAVVATRVGGFVEAIEDGRNGLLVEPRNADALAAGLRRLLSDRALRLRLAAAARDDVVRRFDATSSFGEVEALFADVVRRGQSRATKAQESAGQ